VAHNLYIPPEDPNSIDDLDIVIGVIQPIDHYFGLRKFGNRGTKDTWMGSLDIVTYEATKMISLLAQGNPNILSLLWTKDEHFLYRHPVFNKLRRERSLFVGKHVYKSFAGYASAQIYKMEHSAYEGHMGTKRKELVDKYGFDCKNAAHAIRLLRMGCEFLTTGELQVFRQYDREELLDIKTGKWTLEQVKTEAKRLFDAHREIYDTCTLPEDVNYDDINSLSVEMFEEWFE
jgi:predicted nucleotidyltransferase